ncbi:hypothetical protein DYBT9275_00911 [Dyadobacter sp. CECT 9275]|uniref:Uncharacterized protein n=1 Tax=Dyadobacter helix TaxID=2822344 RepID=A0A916JAA5_9BACT|nr:hypothetical protein DYBT9275_00911 [Dyadobacter sp. CECT 9275]
MFLGQINNKTKIIILVLLPLFLTLPQIRNRPNQLVKPAMGIG